jgi:hypothetical protein
MAWSKPVTLCAGRQRDASLRAREFGRGDSDAVLGASS